MARLQAIIDGSSSTGFTSTSRQEMEMDHPPDHTLDQVEHDSSNGNDDPELASYDIVQAIGQLAIEHYLEGIPCLDSIFLPLLLLNSFQQDKKLRQIPILLS